MSDLLEIDALPGNADWLIVLQRERKARDGTPTDADLLAVPKFNPYHDELGRFAEADDVSGIASNPRHEKAPPALPPQLKRATGTAMRARQKERVRIMEDAYPGVRFSQAPYNDLAADMAAKKYGTVPGLRTPNAIYDKRYPPVTDPTKIEAVRSAARKWGYDVEGGTGYTHYSTIKFATGLPFRDVFGVIRHLQEIDPYAVRMTVDRLGQNVNVRLRFSDKVW